MNISTSFGKRILKGTSILTFRDICTRLIEALRIILITRFFSVEEFGIYGLAIGSSVILATILVMPQFTLALQKFYPEYLRNNEAQARHFIFSTFVYTLLNALVVVIIGWIAAQWIVLDYYQKPELLPYFKWALLLILVQSLSEFSAAVSQLRLPLA
jgi:O-antigen/teichoic acid export membrane protein